MIEYKQYRTLAAYIDRIGAEQLNFRRFMVKEHHGQYYTEKAVITLSIDGIIICDDPEYGPTPPERSAIQEEMATAVFPSAIGAKSLEDLWPLLKGDREDVYEFYNRADGTIRMIQQKVIKKDGQKGYIPWTLFSDGVWRKMEPAGEKLPFWKPKQGLCERYMIHEGAKAARFAHNLVNNQEPQWIKARAAHPWADTLAEYEHWGIIGGALAPHRANYDELKAMNPVETVYICDNDHPGKAALQIVSKNYGQRLKGVMFDGNWKYGWDIADPLPEKFFKKGGYQGPSLESLMRPATYATQPVEVPTGTGNRTKIIHVLRQDFKLEWLHALDPEVYIHKEWSNRVYGADQFNNLVRPFSEVKNTSEILQKEESTNALSIRYMPNAAPGVFAAEGRQGQMVNTFAPTDIKPLKESYDAGPWLEYLSALVPNKEDFLEIQRWCATLIACPEIKMSYGLLLISETQGVGKTTLGEKILQPLIGSWNTSFPSEQQIVDSTFNGWIAHKRLVVINEIYSGNSTKGYDRLKSIITDRSIEVNEKYKPPYTVENWAHVIAASNSLRAVRLSHDDRRWFVPTVAEKIKNKNYWINFNNWLSDENGLRIILAWSKDFVSKNQRVLPGDIAPESTRKSEVIRENLSPGMIIVSDILDDLQSKYKDKPVAVLDAVLVDMIKQRQYDGRFNDRIEKPLTIRKWAKSNGWMIGDERVMHNNIYGRIITNDNTVLQRTTNDNISIGVKFIRSSDLEVF